MTCNQRLDDIIIIIIIIIMPTSHFSIADISEKTYDWWHVIWKYQNGEVAV
jgi:hypothetical protein